MSPGIEIKIRPLLLVPEIAHGIAAARSFNAVS